MPEETSGYSERAKDVIEDRYEHEVEDEDQPRRRAVGRALKEARDRGLMVPEEDQTGR